MFASVNNNDKKKFSLPPKFNIRRQDYFRGRIKEAKESIFTNFSIHQVGVRDCLVSRYIFVFIFIAKGKQNISSSQSVDGRKKFVIEAFIHHERAFRVNCSLRRGPSSGSDEHLLTYRHTVIYSQSELKIIYHR